jgi:heme exporter protein A
VGLDEASQKLLVGLMSQHLKAGGLIVAATHVPLGVKPQKNLHLDGKGQA